MIQPFNCLVKSLKACKRFRTNDRFHLSVGLIAKIGSKLVTTHHILAELVS